MSDRMEKTREALLVLNAYAKVARFSGTPAALAEVEEWEQAQTNLIRDYDERQAEASRYASEARAAEMQRDGLRCLDCATPNQCGLVVRPLCHMKREAAEAERDRLREALGEMLHHIKTRRTSLHMDGTEMFSQPILAQLNGIARAALGEQDG